LWHFAFIEAKIFNPLRKLLYNSQFSLISIFRMSSLTGNASLRIITVNDVYEIDNLPNLKTCLDENKALGDCKVISTLPGDFVAPSLLSSLDKGSSMVKVMNQIGIEYVCIGNHESDIPINHLHQRIRESNFTWINSNMNEFPLPKDIEKLPEYKIIEIKSNGDETHIRRIALLGLCTEDRSVMKNGAFGDCHIEPIAESAKKWYQYLINELKCDTVIPMTHQLISLDREMAKMNVGYPVIIGAHDHEPYQETYGDCQIIKVGMDATTIGIIDINWPNKDTLKPIVNIKQIPAKKYEKNQDTQHLVDQCKLVLKEVELSRLCDIPKDVHLSSVGMRLGPTTMGTFLCTTIRKALRTDLCMIGSGSIRANKNYNTDADDDDDEKSSFFSYADLKAEMPFNTAVTTMYIPGSVCAAMICHTREYALRNPPISKGGYIQCDDKVKWDSETNTVLEINGKPLEPETSYHVTLSHGMCEGLDDVVPFIEWMASKPDTDKNAHRSAEAAIDAKHIIVDYFSKGMLYNIILDIHGDLSDMDSDRNGTISKEEFSNYIKMKTENNINGNDGSVVSGDVTNMLIDNLFAIADIDETGELSIDNFAEFTREYMQNIVFHHDFNSSNKKQMISIENIKDELIKFSENFSTNFQNLLIKDFEESFQLLDDNHDDYININEYQKYLKKRKHLLRENSGKITI
jgi:2',3'-cyclic-nucleotide 2'-phosphodiesterase (5'-nucleotidase family)/Ca2+-binding EF-hand superfamily protein